MRNRTRFCSLPTKPTSRSVGSSYQFRWKILKIFLIGKSTAYQIGFLGGNLDLDFCAKPFLSWKRSRWNLEGLEGTRCIPQSVLSTNWGQREPLSGGRDLTFIHPRLYLAQESLDTMECMATCNICAATHRRRPRGDRSVQGARTGSIYV